MTWARIDEIFDAALERPAAEREAFVEDACAGDTACLAEVRRLLAAADASAGHFEALDPRLVEDAMRGLDAAGSPRTIGPYTLLELLGRGGMGAVYLAERMRDGVRQRVALKVLRRGLDTADILACFHRERRILGSLTHPGIARFIDSGATDDGRPYLALEYVEGVPITAWCDAERADSRQRLALFVEVAEAVQAAHASLVVHRDLKPSNILVSAGRVKLLDFGIAKILADSAGEGERTRTGAVLMTPEIASPEQLSGGAITTATDVFQLGVLLCQLLTGERPPPHGAGRRPTALRGDLDTIVSKAVHPDPQRRYPSVDQFADDIRRYLDHRVISARPDTWTYRAKTFARRRPWVAPLLAGAAAAALLYVATLTWYTVRLAEEREAARVQAERALAVQSFLVELFRSPDPYDPLDPQRLSAITVVEALDIGVQRLRTELVDRPLVREALLSALADVYANLNEHDRALPLREEALALQEARAPGSKDVVDSLARLSSSVGKVRGEAELREVLARWLAAAEALDPPQPAAVAEAHVGMAIHAIAAYDLKTARQHLQAVETMASRTTIPPRILAEAYRSLANLHQAHDELDEARAAAERALVLRVEAEGDDSVDVALARVTLAQVVVGQGDLDAGEQLYERALATLDRRLGPDHRLTLVSLNSLALLRREQNDLDGAATLLRRLVASHRRVHGEHDKLVGDTLQNLATVLGDAGRTAEARQLHQQASEVYRIALGADSYYHALPRLSLASYDLAEGRFGAAERTLQEALPVLRAALPDGHVVRAVADCRLARALDGQGRQPAARELFASAADVLADARSLPAYRAECLQAASAFFAAAGDVGRAQSIRRALGGG